MGLIGCRGVPESRSRLADRPSSRNSRASACAQVSGPGQDVGEEPHVGIQADEAVHR